MPAISTPRHSPAKQLNALPPNKTFKYAVQHFVALTASPLTSYFMICAPIAKICCVRLVREPALISMMTD
jgi:hypothetical protein